MNDSSSGAMRLSASSHDTRGGRGSWNASATASNQPPICSSASSAHVVRAVGFAAEQRGDRRARQIVGVNVVGEHVVLGAQHRRALPQAGRAAGASRRRCPARAGSQSLTP